MIKSRVCIDCGTDTVKNPNKHWFAGPLCDKCYRKRKYNEPSSNKKLYEKEYRKKNKATINAKAAIYVREKSQNDEQFRLKRILRKRLTEALKNNQKAGSAVKDLGCSIKELKVHLESKFLPGMTWDNYGEWEIDHIVPLSGFNLTDRKEFLLACHYTNLQPMWWQDNLKKSDNL
jgi:hypothetical protein